MSRVGFVRIRIRTKRIRIWAWSYRFASCTYGHCTGTSVNVWNLGCTVCMYVYLSPCSAWTLATRCSIRVDSWNSMMKLWNCRETERIFVLNFLFIFRKSSGAISSGDELKNGTTDNNKAQKTDNKDEKTDNKGEKTDNKGEKTDNRDEKTDNKDEKTDKKDENNSTVTDKKDQEGEGIHYNCPEFTIAPFRRFCPKMWTNQWELGKRLNPVCCWFRPEKNRSKKTVHSGSVLPSRIY